jgi:hypothetical protein
MRRPVHITTTTLETGGITYEGIPDQCPICHAFIAPQEITHVLVGSLQGGRLQVVCRCTRNDCGLVFIASYAQRETEHPADNPHYALDSTAPTTFKRHQFPKEVTKVSPRFVEIFNQALEAEGLGLSEVAGPGYRKALEILIKDFLIKQKPEAKAAICSEPLAVCINNYADDPKVKSCANRANWLGTDQGHYIRKWVDKDITHVRDLIQLTVSWIDSTLRTKRYEAEMPTRK